MNGFRLILATLPLLGAAPGLADAPLGVWTGKLGRSQVTACFDGEFASYYYVKIGVDIPLAQQQPGIWQEKSGNKPPTGSWQFSEKNDRSLTGTWKSGDGKRTLPIKLKRASAERTDKYCFSPQYNAARVAAIVRTPGQEVTTGGLVARSFTIFGGTVTGLEILGNSPELAPVKRFVEKLNRDMIDGYFDCMTNAAESGMDFELGGRVALETVTESMLVLRSGTGYFCGGAHPDSEESFYVIDGKSAEPVDINDWLREAGKTIGRKFWKSTREHCADALEEDGSFLFWPSPAGMVFRPLLPHAIDACAEDVTVSWDKLAAKLTAAGKKAAAEFARAAK